MPPLSDAPRALTALLLCGEGSVSCAMLERLINDAGFVVAARVQHWTAAVEHVARSATDVAIVDLELAGFVGVRIIPILRAASPSCDVIAISPLEGIGPRALEAGAREVVGSSDLRPLTAALRRVAASCPPSRPPPDPIR